MLDFASSLYLGLWHASRSLRPWPRLTTGVPAALGDPPGAAAAAEGLAGLQGCQAALLGPSTFHQFWDLFRVLSAERIAVYIDDGAYPIARWGAHEAARRGAVLSEFPHRRADVLQKLIARSPGRPVVLADGLDVREGRSLPLKDYHELVRHYGGLLVLDDTQALGILGHSRSSVAPYGYGGGGSLQWIGIRGDDVILVCSLAKGFGIPIAALSGSRDIIEHFETNSQTRVHCSPVSIAEVHALEHALDLNDRIGDGLRRKLVENIRLFRQLLYEAGVRPSGGLFPVQTLPPMPVEAARDLHARLLKAGVRAIPRGDRRNKTGCISFIITARHNLDAIQYAVNALTTLQSRSQGRCEVSRCESVRNSTGRYTHDTV